MLNANELSNVLDLAARHGAKLPTKVQTTVEHALTMRDLKAPDRAEVTADLLDTLGDPGAFNKKLPTTIDAMVRADATVNLKRAIVDKALQRARQVMAGDSEAVTAAIAKALARYVQVLNRSAGIVPEFFSPTDSEALSPEQFAAWKECAAAVETLDEAAKTLQWLYRGVVADNTIPHAAAVRLPLVVAPGELPTPADAFRFIYAVEGLRKYGSPMGPVQSDHDTFWPARVIHAGGTIGFAGPAATRALAEKLRAACVPPQIERPQSTGRPLRINPLSGRLIP
ncbi:MAG: hypothetical protein ACR2FE_08825 [Aeromicrobium sp.]